jgi:diguanylate cyclase (GGDEF)-like protein
VPWAACWTSNCDLQDPQVKVRLPATERHTVSDDRPSRLDQGTATLSQPWVIALLAAIHLGCSAILPVLTSGSGLLIALAVDLAATAACGVALTRWGVRHQQLPDPVISGVLAIALVAAGVRMGVLGSPWAGTDAVLVALGITILRGRRTFTAIAAGGLAVWAACIAVAWWRHPAPGASWLVGWGMFGAVTGLVVVMRAGIVALEQTLDEVRQQAAERAVLDGLTGAANRKGLEMLALPMIENARRQGQAVHCLYIDIDSFKAVNDAAGDAAGDEVLVALAAALKTSVRATDAVARWSGDEFVVLGPGTGTSPLELERRLRSHLNQVSPVPGDVWSARVSIGSATLVPWDDGDLNALLGRAEQDMRLRRTLRRRSGGRSRPPVASPPSERPVVGHTED